MIILTSLNTLLTMQRVVVDIIPWLFGLNASIFNLLFSIKLAHTIMNNSFYEWVRIILEMKIWKKFRELLRVSYLFHPLLFLIIKNFLPNSFDNKVLTIIHITIVFIFNYIFSYLIHEKIEKTLNIYAAKLSNSIFSIKYFV